MLRDPLYQQILAGLRGSLDPETFERCAAALLRTIYPGLVPIRGGQDAGMDGAIADGRGPAYPLVTTTGRDVLANLKRSLRSYLAEGGRRRRVVLATSQHLTPRRLRNLHDEARALGFTLLQVHAQAAMADLLYRDPAWCRELLNLTGDPPPLSALPVSSRPALTSTLVGRQQDLAWLRETPGDVLIVGEPGCGKTFLLSELARAEKGLFVVTEDLGKIAGGVRAQRPRALLVDDAHLRCDLLAQLRQLRAETGADFRIVADCWPGDRDAVARALAVDPSRVRALGLLTRSEIVQVINACGIAGPGPLLFELVRQADGRPGLAVTLCHLCLAGAVRDITFGDALCRDVRTTFEPLAGRQATDVLAAFAVGGESGMALADVASHLGLSLADVRTIASRLATGGVLAEAGQGVLAVRPEPLREALVRDVFFNDAARLPYDGLLERAPSPEGVARTLVGARGRGGRVPAPLLTTWLRRSSSDETWLGFAYLGPDQVRWVLEDRPERLRSVAAAALHHIPEEAVPLLLSAQAEEQGADHAKGGWALGRVYEWARKGRPGTPEALRTREVLLTASLAWLEAGGSPAVAARAVCAALSPDFLRHGHQPGDQTVLVRWSGLVTRAEMSAIQRLWPGVLDRLVARRLEEWSPLQELVRHWAFPARAGVAVDRRTKTTMARFANRLLHDVARAASDRPSVLRWALELAKVKGVRLPVEVDPEFLTLYPLRRPGDSPEQRERAFRDQEAAARRLAERWAASGDMSHLAGKLALWTTEMGDAQGTWPVWTAFVCRQVASLVPNPADWADALREAGARPETVQPFLARAVDLHEPGWDGCLRACLDDSALRGPAVAVLLQLPDPPEDLLASSLNHLAGLSDLVYDLCVRRTVAERQAHSLLTHPDPEVAAAAAGGEWHAHPMGSVRPGLRSAWREAVLRCRDRVPAGALRADPELAKDWLAGRLQDGEGLWEESDAIREAYAALTPAQRRDLLRLVPDTCGADEVVKNLVGDDVELYRQLLSDQRLAGYHLEPLEGSPEGPWAAKAILALDAGYAARQVAHATLGSVWSWGGDAPDSGAGVIRRFELLESHPDRRMREVGRIGRERVADLVEQHRQRERLEAIHGDD